MLAEIWEVQHGMASRRAGLTCVQPANSRGSVAAAAAAGERRRRQTGGVGRAGWLGWAGAAGVFAAAMAALWFSGSRREQAVVGAIGERELKEARGARPLLPLLVLDAVPVVKLKVESVAYRVGGRFMRQVAAKQEPALLTKSPVKDWPSYQWDLLALARKHKEIELDVAYMIGGAPPVFVMGMERDRGGMIGSPKDLPILTSGVPLLAILRSALDKNVSSMIHLADVRTWEREFNASVGDWNALSVNEKGLEDSTASATIQLVHPGVVLQTSYRVKHLVVNQLQGYKRLLVFPPSETEHISPNIARTFAYSQVHLEQEFNSTTFSSLARGLSFHDITLSPGDSLYIPPNWLMREESITLSLSVHVESSSSVQASFSEAFAHPIPLGDFQTEPSLRGLGILLLLRQIVGLASASENCLPRPSTLPEIASQLLASRYAPYWASSAGAVLPDGYEGPACFASPDNVTVHQLIANNTGNWELAAKRVSGSICGTRVSPFVKLRVLQDYVEQLVRWALGPAQTGAYIKACLSRELD